VRLEPADLREDVLVEAVNQFPGECEGGEQATLAAFDGESERRERVLLLHQKVLHAEDAARIEDVEPVIVERAIKLPAEHENHRSQDSLSSLVKKLVLLQAPLLGELLNRGSAGAILPEPIGGAERHRSKRPIEWF
jgi:hypothetical protein